MPERPLLIVPPPIGRFYFLDLRPGRSFVEYAAGRGLQTFLLSWRNPTAGQSDWDMDTYARRVSAAIDTCREITGSPDVNVIGFCAGGIITTALLNHLAAAHDDRVHSMSYAVTLLDFGLPAPITAFSGQRLLTFACRRSRHKGIITSREMGSAFTWMRPDDLVFNYWVNNYLMGEKPPAFDILAWNADGTNLPGALHGQFLEIFRDNLLTRPGGLTVLGTPVHLERINVPAFVTGAVTDHLTPWKGCYQTTQLLGGPSTFVLSHSGHIASLVNPPGNPKAHYWTGAAPGADPEKWLATAEKQQGSWWETWASWVIPQPADGGQHLRNWAASGTRSWAQRPDCTCATWFPYEHRDRFKDKCWRPRYLHLIRRLSRTASAISAIRCSSMSTTWPSMAAGCSTSSRTPPRRCAWFFGTKSSG